MTKSKKLGKECENDQMLSKLAIDSLERVSDAFVSLDKNWCYTYMNRKAGEIFNRDPEKMIGKNIWEEFPEGVGQPFHQAYVKAMATQEFIFMEEYYQPYDLWFENRIYPSEEGLSIFFHDITDRKKIEKKLILSEEKFNKAFHNSPDAMTITRSSDGHLIEFNDAFLTITGLAAGEVKGKTSLELNLWLVKEERDRYVNLLRLNKYVKDFEVEYITKEGLKRDFLLSGELYESNTDVFILGIMRDITEQKAAQNELKNNQAFIESIINSSPDLIYIYDIDEKKNIYVNEGIQANLGYTDAEIKSLGSELISSLMHPDDFTGYINNTIPRYFATAGKEIVDHDYRMRKKSGEWRWFHSKESVYLRKTDGSPKQIFGIVSDVSDRKKKDMILNSDKQILEMVATGAALTEILDQITRNIESIIEDSYCSILLLDENGINVHIGAAPSLPAGFSNALEGQRIGPEEGSCGTAAYLKKPVIVSDIETDPLWKNYRELALGYNLRSCWSTPVLDKNGDVLGTFAMYYNDCRSPHDSDFELIEHITSVTAITIQRKIEEEELLNHRENLELLVKTRTDELEKEKEKAESADRLKSAFLASMSHELRTPLNSIIGFTGVLLKGRPGPLTAEQVKQLNIIQYSSQHLLDLINDVLDISKIEADQLKVVYEEFNLNELVYSIADSIQPQLKKKNLALEVNINEDINMIYSDKVRVNQIILNIVNNAVKFTERGSVKIGGHKEDNRFIIRISDTGPGIPEDQLSVLFKPFIQVDSGIARRHEGTGLGLYICKKLLRILGGDIYVESEPGIGSTFSIDLPLKPEGEFKPAARD